MRILLTEFRQESNSLSPARSDLKFWRSAGWVLEPGEVRESVGRMPSALSGMIEVLEADPRAPEIVYGPAYYSQSGGTAEQAVMEHYLDGLLPVIKANLPLDGVFISFHGALQTTEFDDAEAEVARRIRDIAGQQVVIAGSMDLHGYISEKSIDNIDIICGYQTYPHVDFVETGRRAARLGLEKISATAPPVMAWSPVPMMVSASAYDTLSGPFQELMQYAQGLVKQGVLLDFSLFQMQPWLDVVAPNSTVLAIARDPEVAVRIAADLAERLYSIRHSLIPQLHSIDAIIDRAEEPSTPKPVLLIDSADSPNAGAPGDSMAVAERLLERGSTARAATVVLDVNSVEHAHRIGVGATAEFTLGGSVDPRAVRVVASGYVRSLHDGEFRLQVVGSSGDTSQLGRSAVIRFGTLDVLVCEALVAPGDPQLYRGFGIEPTMYDLIVIKANTSYRVGYAAIGGTVCEADTPGAAGPNVERLPFVRLSKDVYPWVDNDFVAGSQIARRAAGSPSTIA